jgi:Tfp pilus assembly protein PilO
VSAAAPLRSMWRRRLLLWLPALVFFLANLVTLAVYPVRFAGRVEVTADEVEQAQAALDELVEQRRDLEAQQQAIVRTRLAVDELYTERLAAESERLTRIIAEVKDLASRSGLTPPSVSYPTEPLEEYGLRRRGFAFAVEGSYADLRKFVNLLELSDTFLTLEEVALSDSGGGGLRIQLRVSTLFATGDGPPAAATGVES